MAAPYVEVRTTNAEWATIVIRDDEVGGATVEGINRCRTFIRNLGEKCKGGWNLGTVDWRLLVARFYSEGQPEICAIVHKDDFRFAAYLERISINPDGYLRLRLKGGVKARKLIQAGQWKAPVLRNEIEVT